MTAATAPDASGKEDLARELERLLKAGWKLVALESFEEERALRTLERAARGAGRELRTWSLATGLSPDNKAGLSPDGAGAGSLDAAIAAMTAVEGPTLFVILDAHRVLDDSAGVRRLRDALAHLGRQRQSVAFLGPIVPLPLELERETVSLRLPLPEALELERLFTKVAESARSGEVPPERLAACARAALGLTASEAVRAFRGAWLAEGRLDDAAVDRVVAAKGEALRRSPALSFYEPGAGLDGVGGLDELKRWLRERRRAFGPEARSFGLPAPRGLLLLGVQGCGKSLCAKAIAREWRFPLLRLDLAAAFGQPDKSPELAIREATEVAESLAPVVLWIDEIEKGFAATATDPSAHRVFGSFLTWLSEERAPVFVAATANDVTALPPELLRRGRFDELFFVDLPTATERAEILAIHLARHGRDPKQFPLEELADHAQRLSGAELEQVIAAGLYYAFDEGRELSENDLANAIQETVPLYETYEERIKELRDWARTRARPATLDGRMVGLFEPR